MCQFSAHASRPTQASYLDIPHIYPAGRLDADSEGLVLLTDDGKLQHEISDPARKQPKTYIAQVEGIPSAESLARLRGPLDLGNFVTQPCLAQQIEPPNWLWERDQPIRQRANLPTSWGARARAGGGGRRGRRGAAAGGGPT